MESCDKSWAVEASDSADRLRFGVERIDSGYAAAKMQACSACAGDYEDPDRTAGEEFEAMLEAVEGEDVDEQKVTIED